MFGPHGTQERYAGGCHCAECRRAHNIYQRQYRDNKRMQTQASAKAAREAPAGPVELALEEQLAGLSAAQEQPALAQAALALARVLDGGVPTPAANAARGLADILDRLRKGSDLRKSRLASVRQMSRSAEQTGS